MNQPRVQTAFDKLLKEISEWSPEQWKQKLDHMEATEENQFDLTGCFGSFGHDIMEIESGETHYDEHHERLYMGSYHRHGQGD